MFFLVTLLTCSYYLESVSQSSLYSLCWTEGAQMGQQGKRRRKKDTSPFLTMGVSCTLLSVYFAIHPRNEIHYFCYIIDLVFLLTSSDLCFLPHDPKDSDNSQECLPSTEDTEGERSRKIILSRSSCCVYTKIFNLNVLSITHYYSLYLICICST